MIYKPCEIDSEEKIQLLPQFDICEVTDSLEAKIENSQIDFEEPIKNQLKQIILETENSKVPLINDNYFVKVNFKDTSMYAYAPRRFAFAERKQI